MERKPGRPRKPENWQEPHKADSCCADCRYAKGRFGDSCYCTKYGCIIGWSKVSCRGWSNGEKDRRRPQEVKQG